jgi:DNA repair protein SbcC/Rad50
MTYPRIFSLSTVGILKHYTHDYLFHPLRTDFIGPNGVGKSIIADLLQLMFVYDTSLIRFGTDGVKKEERTIYKLPYNISTAYCFLNVEVQPGKCIIIGISISNQSGNRIIPFVITRSAEIANSFEELYLAKDQLLVAKDFLESQTVPDIKSLASKLLNEKSLFVSFFRTKDEVKRYYQFLYDKCILSINLSVDEHLSAFAKVIQSFSKAKSLDLRPDKVSKSLKEFLFEESERELFEAYQKQQEILEKLLREYSDLNAYTKNLRQKQEQLLALKELGKKQNEALKSLKAAEIDACLYRLSGLQTNEKDTQEQLKLEQQSLELLKETLERLPALRKILDEQNERSNNNYTQYRKYKEHSDKIEELNKDITGLKLLNPPTLSVDWPGSQDQFDFRSRTAKEFKELINFGIPYFNNYKAFHEIEKVYETQSKEISQMRQTIAEEKQYYEQLIAILNNKDAESVFGWGISRIDELTPEQANLLVYYATLPTKAPAVLKKGSRYMNAEELLSKATIIINKKQNGFWVQLGALHEFISFDKEAEVLLQSKNISNTVTEYLEKVKNNHQALEQKEAEINELSKGKTYNRKVINREFDLLLMNYTNVEKLNEAAECAINLKEKIRELEEEKAQTEKELKTIRRSLPLNIKYDEPELVEVDLKIIAERNYQRISNLAAYEGSVKSKLNLAEITISELRSSLFTITNEIIATQQEARQFEEAYFNRFSEVYEPSWSNKKTVEELRTEYSTVDQSYRLKYMEVVNRFDETKDNGNVAVNIELTTKGFSFSVLEEALLGFKVRYTDEIAPALDDANQQRLHMADDIKNTMVKIFETTVERYKEYKDLVYAVNTFFQGRKISDRFYFSIDFKKHERLTIDLVEEIGTKMRNAAKQGELAFDKPVSEFIEEFFKKAARTHDKVPIAKLLDPKTYFELSVSLTDETKTQVPGSTGETYSAIALLGIARLSIVQKEKRTGLRFIILEELGSLDASNFNTFPAIAREFDYQIITMSPFPFRTHLADEWYAHHLIKGIVDKNINYYPTASYFKTKDSSQDIEQYLKLLENELDRVEGTT